MKKFLLVLLLALCLTSCACAQSLEFMGTTFDRDAPAIDFGETSVTDIDALIALIEQMPNLAQVDMYASQLSTADMDRLFDGYPQIFFGWTLNMKGHVVRTDATSFSTLGKQPLLSKQHMVNITFCPNLKALDVGHCLIQDISFLEDCAKLKVLILADAGIKDLSPLASQTEVEYLELFLNDIKDISPLANMTKLRDVNLAFNEITDLSPLYNLPNLERVWLMQNEGLKQEEVDRLQLHQPDCEIVTYSWGATGNRMKKENGQFIQFPGTSWRDHPHYDTIYYIFNGGEYIDWDDPIPENWQKKK